MAVLLQVDSNTLGVNIYLLIGIFLLIGLSGLVGFAVWVGVKMWVQHRREQKTWRQYQAKRRGPDQTV